MIYDIDTLDCKRCPGHRQLGFTLIEVVLSTIIMAILMGAMVSAITISQRAIDDGTSISARTTTARTAIDQITTDLQQAITVTDAHSTSITFTVPDRNGDNIAETIQYAWSGLDGEPIKRTINGVETDLADDVYHLNFSFLIRTISAFEFVGITYDYTIRTPGVDIFSYADNGTSQVPGDDTTPGTGEVLDNAEYDQILTEDGIFFSQATSSNNEYAQQRFEIYLDETPADITQIYVKWIGKGVNENPGKTDGATLYIWKFSGSPEYVLLGNSPETEDISTFSVLLSENADDYVSPTGTLQILAVSSDKKDGKVFDNTLYTDYLSVGISTE